MFLLRKVGGLSTASSLRLYLPSESARTGFDLSGRCSRCLTEPTELADAQVLENTAAIEAEFKRQPRQLEYLHGIVKDLFIDYHKFKGSNVKHRVPQVSRYDPRRTWTTCLV